MNIWAWSLLGVGVFLAVYAVFVLALVIAGRRESARALAGFIPDCIVLCSRLLREPLVPRRKKLLSPWPATLPFLSTSYRTSSPWQANSTTSSSSPLFFAASFAAAASQSSASTGRGPRARSHSFSKWPAEVDGARSHPVRMMTRP
jgi:hypothetical protein